MSIKRYYSEAENMTRGVIVNMLLTIRQQGSKDVEPSAYTTNIIKVLLVPSTENHVSNYPSFEK